jgi:cell division septation protein DedD
MTTADLEKKIAEVLGVSSSEKELAFEIFILKVCEFLSDEVTLKVHRIGFFQLKKGFSKTTAESLLFIPLSEELYRDSKNLFLNIPIPSHHNVEEDFEADVFSISVGKPILPLSESDTDNTETSYAILRKSIEERVSEILSEADQMPNFNIWDDYYKSVRYIEHENEIDTLKELTADLDFKEEFMAEDLTKNLLELSSGIDNEETPKQKDEPSEISLSDLLGDYTPSLNSIPPVEEISYLESREMEDELENKLLNIIENSETQDDSSAAYYKNEYDTPGENILDEQNEVSHSESTNEEFAPEIKNAFEDENDFDIENELQRLIESKSDENESESENDSHVENELQKIIESRLEENEVSDSQIGNGIETTDKKSGFDEVEDIINSLAENTVEEEVGNEEEFVEEEKASNFIEVEVPTKNKEILFEIKRESKLDEVDLDADNEDGEPVYFLGLKKKEGEPIEWDWGDELKEEFGVEFLKDEKNSDDFNEEKNIEETESIDQIFRTTRPTRRTLFDELDSTIKKEIADTEEPHQVLEYSGTPTRYKFVEDTQNNINEKYSGTNYDTFNETKERDMDKNEKGFSFGKSFIIIFASFVVVVALIAYWLLGNKKGNEQSTVVTKSEKENYSLQQQESKNPADTMQNLGDEFSDFPRVASLPAKDIKGNPTVNQNITPVQTQNLVASAQPKSSSANSDLYRTLETDTRVGKTVYFDGKNYNYQVSSWRNKAKAEQEVKRLRGLGLSAFLTEAFLPQKGGTWYRVRVGNFKSREEAEQNSIKNNF